MLQTLACLPTATEQQNYNWPDFTGFPNSSSQQNTRIQRQRRIFSDRKSTLILYLIFSIYLTANLTTVLLGPTPKNPWLTLLLDKYTQQRHEISTVLIVMAQHNDCWSGLVWHMWEGCYNKCSDKSFFFNYLIFRQSQQLYFENKTMAKIQLILGLIL